MALFKRKKAQTDTIINKKNIKLGIKADYVAGTSAGSMVGALYAAGYSPEQMIEELKKLRVKDIRDSKVIWKPSDSSNIEEVLKNIFGKDLMFSELKTPLSIVAVDIKTGSQVNITSGSVAKASSGSCAIPWAFSPVIYEDMHLVDGGLTCTVPADVVRAMGADVVLAIEVNRKRGSGTDSLKMKDVLSASLGIIMQANVKKTLKYADLVLKPDLERFSSSKPGDIDAMVKAGYDAVMENKDRIIKLVTSKPKGKLIKLFNKLEKVSND